MSDIGKIGTSEVRIEVGDLSALETDAYIVPEFTEAASFQGVGGAIARAGGEAGLEMFDAFVQENGELAWGSVLITPSGGGKAKHLLHVVSVGAGPSSEFEVIQSGFYNALRVAEQNELTDIIAPALGTGLAGRLTPDQSAKAMMSALARYSDEGARPLKVTFVIFGDSLADEAFRSVLHDESYREAGPQRGRKEINPLLFLNTVISDAPPSRRRSSGTEPPDSPSTGPVGGMGF